MDTKINAQLTMRLKANSGYECEAKVGVSPQQWYLINRITNTKHPSHFHRTQRRPYTLLHIAKNEDDKSEQAVYIGPDGQIWVMPQEEFDEMFIEIS